MMIVKVILGANLLLACSASEAIAKAWANFVKQGEKHLEKFLGTGTTESTDGSAIKAAGTNVNSVEEVVAPPSSAPQANTSSASTIVANSKANSTNDTLSKAQKAERGTLAENLPKAGKPESGVPGCLNKEGCVESKQLAPTKVERALAHGKQLIKRLAKSAAEVDSVMKAPEKATVATTGSAGSAQEVAAHEESIQAAAAPTPCTNTEVDGNGNVVCVPACNTADGTICPPKHARRRLSSAFAQVCRKLGMTVHGERL